MRKLVFGRRVYDVWTAVWLTDDGRPPMAPNDRWSLDFVSDQLTDGRRFRILTVVDDCTRECLALVADTSLSGTRVARELDRLMTERGRPRMVVSDNGTELTSNAILTWADQSPVAWHYIRRASQCRMPSSRASMAGCGTNC
jgi:transposase InsO family protein